MSEIVYYSKIEDVEDGSGDGILTIPPEIIKQTGWKEGTKLDISLGENGEIILQEI
jgi:bifunctional DNA-binding transcriptional regulator/antitoxin component of YhaV-PrlF toxin-antitoxin module